MTRRRGPRPVGERLRRLLVVLPWLMERGESTLAEMSERFRISEADLVRDLELVAMCGLPPFLDELVDLSIDDDGTVTVGIPRFFTAPLRLTAPEAFDVLVAGRVAMELPGADPQGPLGRALTKLEQHLGADAMVVEMGRPAVADDLAAAIEDAVAATGEPGASEWVTITYWSARSDAVTERTIAPRLVFTDRGNWYVVADDDRSGEERIFRLDRVETWSRTGRPAPARTAEAPTADAWFDDQGDLPTAVLRIGAAGRWVVEQVPTRSVRELEPDAPVGAGAVEVELVVASERWLAELLLRLGPHVTVVSPEGWRDLAGRSARELLAARYAATS